MKEVFDRLCGLLEQEIDAYERLHRSIATERQCLLARSLKGLHAALEVQQNIVDEIYKIDGARRQEYEVLASQHHFREVGAAGRPQFSDDNLPPEARQRWMALRERLRQQILVTRDLNSQNLKVIKISRDVFEGYLHELANLSALSGGYTAQGQVHPSTGSALLDQRS